MVTLDDIRAAATRIAPYIHRTPTFTSQAVNDILGARIVFKGEHLERRVPAWIVEIYYKDDG